MPEQDMTLTSEEVAEQKGKRNPIGEAVKKKYGDIGAFRGYFNATLRKHFIIKDNSTSNPFNMAFYLSQDLLNIKKKKQWNKI